MEVLGITVVTGDQWRNEELARTLRLLEIIGRTDVPVIPGAEFPLVRGRYETQLWQERYGKVAYAGAWDDRWWHEPNVIPALAEGQPARKASDEDAARFLIRMVRKYPHEVTIYEGDPEFVNNPRHEFNFWLDPEAAKIALRAPWKKITCTPVDISIRTHLTPAMVKEIEASGTPLAHYIARFSQPGPPFDYMWDELAAAAWIDPSIITKRETRYLSVDLDQGAGYGNTLTWTDQDKSKLPAQKVETQIDLDLQKFNRMFVDVMKK